MRNFVLIVAILFLAACSVEQPEGGATAKAAEKSTGGVIPQHQLDAMKKAEDVSGMLQQSEQKRREQTE